MMTDVGSVQTLLRSLENVADVEAMSTMLIEQLNEVSCKTAIRLVKRALTVANQRSEESKAAQQLSALESILQDAAGDETVTSRVCQI